MKPIHRLLWAFSISILCVISSAFAESVEENAAVAAQKPVTTNPSEQPAAKTRTVEELAELINQSVVVVSYVGRDGKRAGVGAGFVVSADGLIATNLHVIGEAREISVQISDGKTYQVTSIHATDRPMDLALIRIDAEDLVPLQLGDSDTLKQGQDMVAVGNPQGLKFSIVRGIVSGKRKIEGMPMIQMAIPIEPGNSGGPLLDMQGRVHGILTLKSVVTRNLGFAMEINALKLLLRKPNPVPMSRWLTIGTLDPNQWQTLFGARWKQRAGRILVEGSGDGFGGRSLCLSNIAVKDRPIEIGVSVRMKQEDGAAGLVFHSDGNQKHYGFYPSSGKVRLSRFEGPDVFSWKVLQEVKSPHYRSGNWNYLKVRLEKARIQCFLNDELVIESTDSVFTEGRIGLAKFRHTAADFKGFQVGNQLTDKKPSVESTAHITKLIAGISTSRPPQRELIDALLPFASDSTQVLEDRARELEQRAERLRQLAKGVHEKTIRTQLVELLRKDDDKVDLLRAALMVSQLDNPELDVPSYLREVDRLAEEIKSTFSKNADENAKLKAMDKFLFEQLGFHGSRTEYYNSSNSYLNEVIDDREGLPITISVLYMELARRLGLKVVGVGLPGHFVVRYEPQKGDGQLIDAFERGKRLSRKQAEEIVRKTAFRELDDQHLVAQKKKDIVQRMLHNLMGLARKSQDAERMLRYVETIISLNPKTGPERWFRVVLRIQTNRNLEALEDIEWLLEEKPENVDLQRVRQLQIHLQREMQNPDHK
jgi:serine protease Do